MEGRKNWKTAAGINLYRCIACPKPNFLALKSDDKIWKKKQRKKEIPPTKIRKKRRERDRKKIEAEITVYTYAATIK